jgi:hypothetical protein
MNRLAALEANSTLYARYVEAHASAVRDALRRMSEDVGRLEGIAQAQARRLDRALDELALLRERDTIAKTELAARVEYLADEIELEKRLGIAQLLLLLAVLIFMALTRGAVAGAPPRGSVRPARDNLRGQRRHTLSFSGDLVTRPRADSGGATTAVAAASAAAAVATQGSTSVRSPSPRVRLLSDASNDDSPRRIVTPRPIHPVPGLRTPLSRYFREHSTPPPPHGGSRRPPPPFRANSVSVLAFAGVGPVPRSAKRWARTAHLHEVPRRGRAEQLREHAVGTDERRFTSARESRERLEDENDPGLGRGGSMSARLIPRDGSPVLKGSLGRRGPLMPLAPISAPPVIVTAGSNMNGLVADETDGDVWVDTDADMSEAG